MKALDALAATERLVGVVHPRVFEQAAFVLARLAALLTRVGGQIVGVRGAHVLGNFGVVATAMTAQQATTTGRSTVKGIG